MKFKEISGKDLENISTKAKIIDVREEDEYKEGHVKNAINIPLSKILYNDFDLDKNSDLIIYCRSNGRSTRAIEILSELGFKNLTLAPGVALYDYDLEK